MKDIKVIKGKYHIARLIEQGEHECQDFKHSISDAAKIAHSISAFANNKGGRLLIGVKDNGSIAGIRNEEDIYVVEQAAEMYCRPPQKVGFKAYNVDNGTVVIVAEITKSDIRPVLARETDGVWKAYFRVADENIVAHPLMVEAWRRKSEPSATPAIICDAHRKVLDSIDTSGHTHADIRAVAIKAGISEAAASAAIVDLAALEIISFIHGPNGFFLSLTETP